MVVRLSFGERPAEGEPWEGSAQLAVRVALAEEPALRVVPFGDARSQHAHERRDAPGAGLAVRLREVGQLVEKLAGLVEVAEDAGLLLGGAGLLDPLRSIPRVPFQGSRCHSGQPVERGGSDGYQEDGPAYSKVSSRRSA